MSRKKKRRASRKGRSSGDSDDSLAYNPFADLDKSVSVDEDREPPPAPTGGKRYTGRAPASRRTRSKKKSSDAPVEMSAEELFAAAVDGLTPADIDKGKYAGKGPDTSHVRIKEEESLAPAEIYELEVEDDPYHDEMALFEEMMRDDGVERVDSKYHVPEPSTTPVHSDARARLERMVAAEEGRGSRQERLDELDRDGGPRLSASQRYLVKEVDKRARAGKIIPTVNVRGDTREVAVAKVEQACKEAALGGRPYVRVITGKGLRSETRPVLKRAVVDWALTTGEGVVFTYAPEVETDGTFGSIIFQVRRKRRSRS